MKRAMQIKKMAGIFILALVVCGVGFTGTIVRAETKDFTLTLTKSGVGNDALSQKTIKAGGKSYENKYYVRTTSMQGVGIIYVKSIKYSNNNIKSKQDLSLNSKTSIGITKSCEYNKYAPAGDSYYLQGRYAQNSSSSKIKAVGRYTP